mmetsp:Transcript_3926/g.5163  ORF Transcript_3926/g.5163 Transcript_3926/m.5163 type:complete len:273 (-) Transcript_3926:152-970(-)
MKSCVTVSVLGIHVGSHTNQVFNHLVMSKKGSLVNCATTRLSFLGVDVDTFRNDLDALDGTVHAQITKDLILGGSWSRCLFRIWLAVCWATQRKEAAKYIGKILAKEFTILGVSLDVWQEFFVLNQAHVRWQHHELTRRIGELHRTTPFTGFPFFVQQQLEVLVIKFQRVVRPWAVETRTSFVARSEGMGTTQGDDVLVIKSHAVEDIAQMLSTLSRIRQTTMRRASGCIRGIGTSVVERHIRSSTLLNRFNASHDPKIRIRKIRKFVFQRS